MNIELEKGGSSAPGVPKHERLKEYLLRELTEGRLRPGNSLPTESELGQAAQVSRNTVRHALGELERSGLIRRVRGSGTFVHEQAMERLHSGLDIFALVIPDSRGGYYPSLQRGFHTASVGRLNQVIVCDTENDPHRQADALLQLLDKKVAGVAVVPTTSPVSAAYQMRPLHERGIPIVFCHRRIEGVQAPLVTFSALEVGQMAGKAMLEKGHRRAAFFAYQRTGLSSQYEKGLREMLESGGGELPEQFARYDDAPRVMSEHERFFKENLSNVLQSKTPPTVLFCPFDAEAELAYVLLSQLGVRVPEDISLISFGGTWREGAVTRRLAAVAVDEEQLGRQAADLLHQIRRRERPLNDPTEIFIPLSWLDGETLGPAPTPARASL